MKVGILSDTHNDKQALLLILQRFRDEKISTIIHCGDVTSPEMIKYFSGFTVHLGFGNGDYFTGALREELILLATYSTAKRVNVLSLEGKKIAIAHGNYEQEFTKLTSSNRFDLIFTGHTHIRGKSQHGKTLIINPGAASRTGEPAYSYGTYDFLKDTVHFHQAKF